MSDRARIIFITGTDTSVGKTALTSLLLAHLRQRGERAIALKPFCSGGRADAELLHALQGGQLSLDHINPFHFDEPLAPLVAARLHRRKISLSSVLDSIRALATSLSSPRFKVQTSHSAFYSDPTNPPIHKPNNPFLLVEGAGGLLSPLGERFDLLTLIQNIIKGEKAARPNVVAGVPPAVEPWRLARRLSAPSSGGARMHSNVSVIVVSANRLGTINHTLLTLHKLQDTRIKKIAVVLNNIAPPLQATPDMKTNFEVLTELLDPLPVFNFPHLKGSLDDVKRLRTLSQTHRRLLSKIIEAFQ